MANTAFDHAPTITVPGSGNSTDNAVVLWNGTTGNNFSNSLVIITSGAVTGVTTLAASTSMTVPTTILTNGTNAYTITLNTGATAANYTITLPVAVPGAVGKVLQSSGGSPHSVLEWATPSGGTITALSGDAEDRIPTFGSTTTVLDGSSGLTFNGTTLTIGSDYDLSDANGLYKRTNGTLQLNSNSSMAFNIDSDNNQSGRSFWFYNNSVSQSGTQIMELAENGNLNVMLGNVIIGTAGKGIDFSASTHSTTPAGETTMDNELFDDYEEGAWTPRTRDSAGNSGASHATQVGRYTKIGNLCYITCYVVNDGQGNLGSSNTIALYQLPFTSENVTGQQSGFTVTSGQGWSITANTQVTGRIMPNTTIMDFRLTDTPSGGGNMLVSEWTGSGGAVISGFYRTVT